MVKKNIIKTIVFLLAFVFILSGCSLVSGPLKHGGKPPEDGKNSAGIKKELAAQSKIKKFADLDELKEFLDEEAGQALSYGRGLEGGLAVNFGMFGKEAVMDKAPVPMAAKAEASQTAGRGGVSEDFSRTNVQVEGVDEADIIKTDGKYIYAVVKSDLYIVDAYPPDKAEVMAKIAFRSRPRDIFINGKKGRTADRLLVFGTDSTLYKTDAYKRFRRRGQFTFLKVFDISDKRNPKQVRDLDFEGGYFNSRLIGDYVYFVINNYNYYYIEGEPVLPRVLAGGEVLSNRCVAGVKCFAPDVYYFSLPYDSYNFTTIVAINVQDASAPLGGEIYLLPASQNMYVSRHNIYLAYTKYISEYRLEMGVLKEIVFPHLSARQRERIVKIEAVENFILSSAEKMAKVSRIIENYAASLSDEEQENLKNLLEKKMREKYRDISGELEKTVIHKIGISRDKLEYRASGEVTGRILNQFSMDEAGDYFRIATTKSRTWARYAENNQESYSNIYVLDNNLKVTGAAEHLAPGERIYAARFMQNRAYLVTFKQVDPLFVVDLSDPQNLKVLGKLKVPGFSSYLHPYNSRILIGIGKDATEKGRVKGLKLSLFDVSDVNNPKEIDTYAMGEAGSDSIALRDHKAFLFSREKNLLVLPVRLRGGVDILPLNPIAPGAEEILPPRPQSVFSGAAVFFVNENGFKLKGKISHSEDGYASGRDYWRGYSYYDNTVKRSLYLDDTLYTFSNRYLKMNKISDLELIKKLRLKKEKSKGDDFEVIN